MGQNLFLSSCGQSSRVGRKSAARGRPRCSGKRPLLPASNRWPPASPAPVPPPLLPLLLLLHSWSCSSSFYSQSCKGRSPRSRTVTFGLRSNKSISLRRQQVGTFWVWNFMKILQIGNTDCKSFFCPSPYSHYKQRILVVRFSLQKITEIRGRLLTWPSRAGALSKVVNYSNSNNIQIS